MAATPEIGRPDLCVRLRLRLHTQMHASLGCVQVLSVRRRDEERVLLGELELSFSHLHEPTSPPVGTAAPFVCSELSIAFVPWKSALRLCISARPGPLTRCTHPCHAMPCHLPPRTALHSEPQCDGVHLHCARR